MDAISAINWAALIAFYLGIAYFFYRHRKQVESQWKIFFIYRTKRGIAFIHKLAEKARGFWMAYGYIGVPIAFAFMILIIYTLSRAVINLFVAPSIAKPAAALVLPWATTGTHGAIITVSVWYFVLSLIVTIVVHEGAHAVVAVAHKLKLKSTGVGLFALLPFAFVEPDEDQISKAKTRTQLAIFAAGPFTNIITAVLIALVAFFLVLPGVAGSMQVNGLEITEINASLPAGSTNLEVGDVITKIDNVSFYNTDVIPRYLISPMYQNMVDLPDENYDALSLTPNQTVMLYTEDKVISITVAVHPDNASRGIMGLSFNKLLEPKAGSDVKIFLLGTLYNLLAWIAVFNLGIGIFNLLPIGGLDGGRMLKTAMQRLIKKEKIGLKLFSVVSVLVLLVLLLGVFGPYLIKLF